MDKQNNKDLNQSTGEHTPFNYNVDNFFKSYYWISTTITVVLLLFTLQSFISWFSDYTAFIQDDDLRSNIFMLGIIGYAVLCVLIPYLVTRLILRVARKT